MIDELKLNHDKERAARAEALLRDELLQEAFAALEKRYTDEWRVTQVRDTDARERLWQAVNIVGKVRDHLTMQVASGKLAQRQLDDLAANKPKRFGII
jgi:hypothetical protein